MRPVLAQARLELKLTLRRGESLLVTFGIPLGVLVFFSTVDVLAEGVDFLVPGVLALSAAAMGMVSLGIATGFERQAGVLKRLGATPLGRGGLLGAKAASVLVVTAVQAGLVLAVGITLGWRPAGSVLAALGLLAVGVVAFSGLGFLLAGNLRAETNLAAANGLFLLFLLLGGVVVPVTSLPDALASAARALPIEPLAAGLRAALDGDPVPGRALAGLGAWTVGAVLLAARTFRWE